MTHHHLAVPLATGDNEHESLSSSSSYQRKNAIPHDAASHTRDANNNRFFHHQMSSSSSSSSSHYERLRYNWRLYAPRPKQHCINFFRWILVGGAANAAEQSHEVMLENLRKLARCLTYLRAYESQYGMPADNKGDRRDRAYVLRQVVRDLYSGGTPVWALDSVMEKAVQGLTGSLGNNWLFLPRKAFCYAPAAETTTMFSMDRGYCIKRLDDMEKVVVKMASHASNTSGVANVPTCRSFPRHDELREVAEYESACQRKLSGLVDFSLGSSNPDDMANNILSLSSEALGLFYFLNAIEHQENGAADDDGHDHPTTAVQVHDFWIVSDTERELFSRLATMDAMRAIDKIDNDNNRGHPMYPDWLRILFRILSAGGSAIFWFGGSWYDMVVAGALNILVGFIAQSRLLTKNERVMLEMVAGFIVGLAAGLVVLLHWPDKTCFSAIALGALIDLFQGFRIVYAVIETMSKRTVTGAADLVEAILFTWLIAICLCVGQYIAGLMSNSDEVFIHASCAQENKVNEAWYLLLVPLAAISWSCYFGPHYSDVPIMAAHGVMSFSVNYGLTHIGASAYFSSFVSALCVTFSASIVSRFTGHQAVGSILAGMWALVPGSYMFKTIFLSRMDSTFITDVLQRAVVIGIGSWTGTLLCAPTVLETTKSAMDQQKSFRMRLSDRERHHRHEENPINEDIFTF